MILYYIFAVTVLVGPLETFIILKSQPFGCEEIVKSLKYHNEMRNRVALGNTKLSGAKNMIQLKWDEELANIAYKHSQTCDFHHNPERPHGVGENIAQRNISKDGKDTKLLLDYVDMMTMWYNEIDNYNENGNHTGVVDSFTRIALQVSGIFDPLLEGKSHFN